MPALLITLKVLALGIGLGACWIGLCYACDCLTGQHGERDPL